MLSTIIIFLTSYIERKNILPIRNQLFAILISLISEQRSRGGGLTNQCAYRGNFTPLFWKGAPRKIKHFLNSFCKLNLKEPEDLPSPLLHFKFFQGRITPISLRGGCPQFLSGEDVPQFLLGEDVHQFVYYLVALVNLVLWFFSVFSTVLDLLNSREHFLLTKKATYFLLAFQIHR